MSGYSQKNKLTTDQHPENMKITCPILQANVSEYIMRIWEITIYTWIIKNSCTQVACKG